MFATNVKSTLMEKTVNGITSNAEQDDLEHALLQANSLIEWAVSQHRAREMPQGGHDPEDSMTETTLDKHVTAPACRALLHGTSELIRAGVRTILDAEPDIAVVGEVDRLGDIDSCVRRYRPNVLVTEYSLGSNTVNWGVGDHRSGGFQVSTVMLCPEPRGPDLDRAIRAGVRGFVLRTGGSGEVVDAVRSVAAGNAFLAPSVAGYVLEQLAIRMPPVNDRIGEQLNRLTAREREVLRLVASGLTTAEAANIMCRSRATVKSHISHILAKLELQDRAQAIALAYQAGMMVNIVHPG